MLTEIRKTFAPLISLFFFTLGSALFNTLITLNVHSRGGNSTLVGALTAAYYLGLALGSFRIERFIVRVGHIRAFSTFASTFAVASLFQGIVLNFTLWVFLRLVTGFVTAGLFIVIESWILTRSTPVTRGQILAIYMVVLYAAQAFGQFLIKLGSITDLLQFAVVAMLCSLSVIPLAMTYTRSPEFSEPSALSFKKLYQTAASGVIGCLCSGLILGAIYGLIPLYVSQRSGDVLLVAKFMSAIIFGGMALQYPLGRLSDRVDRRLVLIFASLAAIVCCVGVMLWFNYYWLSISLCFLLGGFTFTLYPISISHACDALDNKDIVAGTQGLLLAYSIGATIGPLIAPGFMQVLKANGLFIYLIAVCVFMAVFFVWRRTYKPTPPSEEQFVTMPQTTPILAELKPRAE